MSTAAASNTITVALIGNPNTGKSTLFNALCGVRQRVGNYPGVTVEKKTGRLEVDGRSFELVDLPGTYSLAPRSPDEMVAVDVLLGRREDVGRVDVLLCIIDASNLERNLYLVSQALELGLPTVVALNMADVAAARGISVDVALLSERLGAPVVPTEAHRGQGLDALKAAVAAAQSGKPPAPLSPFPQPFQQEVAALGERIADAAPQPWPRYLVERLLLDTSGWLESAGLPGETGEVIAEVHAARGRLREAGCPIPAVEAMSRYRWVAEMLDGVVKHPPSRPVTLSDRLDRVLTHRIWGSLVFIVLMVIVFQSIFTWAGPAMDGVEWIFERIGGAVAGTMPDGALKSLVLDGVIAGVGGVLVFLPQIFLLFFFIALLEDCGYMARAAYLMDRLMSRIGLSGKSFIPLLSSFACAIPGVMAARVIENRRDRLITILVAPLMSCSARLPVYTLLIAAFIPDRLLWGWNVQWGEHSLGLGVGLQGATMLTMYSIGVAAAVLVALVLRKTILRGATPPFVMELPSYKLPSLWTVLHRMGERGWAFIRRAGTLIFAVSILVWAASYFPRPGELEQEIRAAHAAEFPPEQIAAQTADAQARLAALTTEGEMYAATIEDLTARIDELEGLEGEIRQPHRRRLPRTELPRPGRATD